MSLQNTKVHAGNFTERVQEKLQSLGITFSSGETETPRAKCDFIFIYKEGYRVSDDLEHFNSNKFKEVTIKHILSIELPKKETDEELIERLWGERKPSYDCDSDGKERFWGTVLCIIEDFQNIKNNN